MVISELFIRRPVLTTLLMVVLSVFGMWSYFSLPVNSLPTVDYPVIQVNVSYPGASPSTMASTVATPLENEFTQISGIRAMIADNKYGSTSISLTFGLERNVDLVAPDVQAAISRAIRNLPQDLPAPPSYQKFNPSDAPIYFIMVYSDVLTHGDLYDYANHILAKKLSMLEGVSKVDIRGAPRAVRIQFRPEKLAACQIGIDELAEALKEGTVSIPGGSLNGPSRTFSIEPQGQLMTAREYDELIVAQRSNASVRLKDVATCVDSITRDMIDLRYFKKGDKANDQVSDKCVAMMVSRESGANTVAVADRISKAIEEVKRSLPGSVKVEQMFDGAWAIRESLKDVQLTVGIALLLVVLVIFLFLGRVRETIVPTVVLPVTLLGTMMLMQSSRFSLDTLSLMGIVLAIGFLVDDAIVVLENTVRHLDAGEKPIPAAVRSMGEVTFTVISTSAALIIVFIPLVFMTGAVGRNLREFAVTVIYAIIVSTVVALTLTPMMCARIVKHHKDPNAFQRAIAAVVGALVRQYGQALSWQLRHRWAALAMWLACILGSVAVFGLLPKTFLPRGDSSFVRGALVMPQGSSTEQIRAFQSAVIGILTKDPDVIQMGSMTGSTPGADQSSGFVFLRLRPPGERTRSIEQCVMQFTKQLAMLPYGVCFLQPSPVLRISSGAESTASGSSYAYMLVGLDRELVYSSAQRLEAEMRGIRGLFGVQNNIKLNMPRLRIEIDRDRASALGLTAQTIEQALATAFAGGQVTQFMTDNDQYQVILEVAKEYQRLPDDLSMLYVRAPVTGTLVPLNSVARWREEASPQNIPHAQQQEAATLSFSLAPDIALGDAVKAIEDVAAKIVPAGVTGQFTGDALEFQKSITSLFVMLLVAIFLKYVMLGILYESYIHPFTILTTLPVAALGGLFTLLICGRELSLYAYIGLFVLIGLITKNGILMVDFAEQRKREGMSSVDAIHDACLVRFRPILMTGLCAIFGIMPIALGFGTDGTSRVPLGLMVVGGMAFAQVITLFVTPGIYLYMEAIQARFFTQRTDLE